MVGHIFSGEANALRVQQGDKVVWNSHGHHDTRLVVPHVTSGTKATGRKVRSSDEEPQYCVRSEKGGGDCDPRAGGAEEAVIVSSKTIAGDPQSR